MYSIVVTIDVKMNICSSGSRVLDRDTMQDYDRRDLSLRVLGRSCGERKYRTQERRTEGDAQDGGTDSHGHRSLQSRVPAMPSSVGIEHRGLFDMVCLKISFVH